MMGLIIFLILLIILSGIFSGMETAMLSITMIKAHSLERRKIKGADALLRLKQEPHKLIITILLMNNLVNISAATLATVIFTDLFGSSGVGIATGIMTFVILVFGEICPKSIAAHNPENIALKVAKPLEIFIYAIYPIVKFFEFIAKTATKFFGGKKSAHISEDEIRTIVVMGEKEGILSKDVADMMNNVLEFEERTVTDIMTPFEYVEMLDGNKKLKQILNFIIKSRYSKFPIYSSTNNNIIGLLHIDDVLKYLKNKKVEIKIKFLIKKIPFVPESKRVEDLLNEFEGKDIPAAMVVDEYGAILGLVTLEDILEEIVGDIFDKSRTNSVYVKRLNKKQALIDPKISINDVNKIFSLNLKKENFNTLAGFIEHRLKRIPIKGEKIRLKNNVMIEVVSVTKKGIKSVKLIKYK